MGTDLSILRSLLSNEKTPAAILDAAWQPIWQNCTPAPRWKDALCLHDDDWESGVFPFFWDDVLWDCAVSCDKEHGIRTVILHERHDIEEEVAVTSAMAIRTSSVALHTLLAENGLSDDTTLQMLKVLHVSDVKLYLPSFCRRATIGMLRSSKSSSIELSNLLITFHDLAMSTLRQVASISLTQDEVYLWVNGPDPDDLIATRLGGIVLTSRDTSRPHDISLSTAVDDGIVTISIVTYARPAQSGTFHAASFGSTQQFQALIDLFCRLFDAEWTLEDSGLSMVGRLRMHYTTHPRGTIALYSAEAFRDRPFFGMYEMLLAPLVYRAEP